MFDKARRLETSDTSAESNCRPEDEDRNIEEGQDRQARSRQAPRLAQFIGLDPVAVEYAEAAEAVFDFHLRHGCKTRARVSQIVDDELTFGFGVAI